MFIISFQGTFISGSHSIDSNFISKPWHENEFNTGKVQISLVRKERTL